MFDTLDPTKCSSGDKNALALLSAEDCDALFNQLVRVANYSGL